MYIVDVLTLTKTCTKCGRELPLKRFNTTKYHKDGLRSHCKDCEVAYTGRWRIKNRNRDRQSNTERSNKYNAAMKIRAIDILGGCKCSCPGCMEINIGFLTVDHINNDGGEHRKKIGGGGVKLYRWIINNQEEARRTLRVLCYNCNCGRYSNGGVCPHCK